MRRALLLALGFAWLPLMSCSNADPSTPPPSGDAGLDGAKPAPSFDPTKGSFAPARAAVAAFLAQGEAAGLGVPSRFFPASDPLFIMNALGEVTRSKSQSLGCNNGQFGCPDPAFANQLLAEYGANKAALLGGLKKAQAVQHAWGRVGLAQILIGLLNVLEQAKALDAADVSALLLEAGALQTALATPTFTKAGVYPDLSPNAALYRGAFKGISPAPEMSPAHVAAANQFISAVFNRLTTTPNDAQAACGQLVDRFKKGIIVQGIIVQGIIVQGTTAAQAFEALPYFIGSGASADPSLVDDYGTAIDAIVPLASAGTASGSDWTKYVTALDRLTASFDGPIGELVGAHLNANVSTEPKAITDALEDDPNVIAKTNVSDLTATGLYGRYFFPTVGIFTVGAVRPPMFDRRSPVSVPGGVDVALPTRTVPSVAGLNDLFAVSKPKSIVIGWDRSRSAADATFDHFDVRIENLSSKKIVFHKIYRRLLDDSIGTVTIVPVDGTWFTPGSVNDLQVRVAGVDRRGWPTGIACGSLAFEVDASTYATTPPGPGKCFARGVDDDDPGLAVPPAPVNVVIGNYLGSPFRPSHFAASAGGVISIFNDSSTPRRLVSLFTPDYSEVPTGIDLALRKLGSDPGVLPIDTGTIAPHTKVDVPMGASLPAGFTYSFYDPTNGPKFRLRLGTFPGSAPGW